MPLCQVCAQHQSIAKRIDAPWNPRRQRMNQIEALRLETGIARPANVVKAVLDIGLRLLSVERTQVIGSGNALPELLHLRALHHGAQLGLADEKALKQC